MSKPEAARYRTTNWKSYNEALRRRGSLLIWLDKDMVWLANTVGRRGRPPVFSDAAIQFCLMVKVLFGLPLRQTTGMVASILKMAGLDWPVPDFSTLSRRQGSLVVDIPHRRATGPLNLLVNAGNGTAGPTFDAIAAELARRGAPLSFIRVNHDPDPGFPNGIPNPLLPENQPMTAEAVRAHGADLGVAWDGDFDRCFFFDENGTFIPGEYIVGLLATAFLEKHPGEKIVHDPRVVLNSRDMIARAGGRAVQARTGHAYVKRAMRESGAIYGGEMSAHHYFRDFHYADSGMVPWLLVAELLSRQDTSLGALLAERMRAFPSSGEINFRLDDPGAAIDRVVAHFAPQARRRDDNDGISLEVDDWRFKLRSSNTEPVVRLNVESRGDAALVAARRAEIEALLTGEQPLDD